MNAPRRNCRSLVMPHLPLRAAGHEFWPSGNDAIQLIRRYNPSMLSHKSKYALEALLVLSEEYGNGPLLISEIATREHIPKRFLELILLELKNHGVLRS